MSRRTTTLKMIGAGAIMVIGGPMLVQYVRPTEEELFQKFNSDLQRRNLELKDRRQHDFDDFVKQLKEHSKSDKTIWDAYRESEEKRLREYNKERQTEKANALTQKEEIQREISK